MMLFRPFRHVGAIGLLIATATAGLAPAAADAQQPPTRKPTPARPAKPAVVKAAAKDSAVVAPAPAGPRMPMASLLGSVFDSLHLQPLTKANVAIEGTTRIGATNADGQFKLDSIPPGTWQVRVMHPLLDSIGLSILTDPMTFVDQGVQAVALAVPSSEMLVELSCPAARRALGPSALIGRLLDADSDDPVQGGRVSIAWTEISIMDRLRRVPRVRDALSGADGVFRICGLPKEMEGTVQAVNKGISTAEVKVVFEGQPLIVQGLRIGSVKTVAVGTPDSVPPTPRDPRQGQRLSAATMQSGNASVKGRVVTATGTPVVGARVDVTGTKGASLTGASGEFVINGLPSGTQSVVVRQLGYAPVETAVDLSTRTVADVKVTLSRQAQVLAGVTVGADRNLGLDRIGFTSRKRSGSGYFLTGDDVMKRAPTQLSDVFRSVPSLRVVPAGTDYVVESARGPNGCVRYFVDGSPWESLFPGDVDRLVPPWEIAAMEVYNGAAVPAQFQMAGNSSCAAIVIWSKTRVEHQAKRKD